MIHNFHKYGILAALPQILQDIYFVLNALSSAGLLKHFEGVELVSRAETGHEHLRVRAVVDFLN